MGDRLWEWLSFIVVSVIVVIGVAGLKCIVETQYALVAVQLLL